MFGLFIGRMGGIGNVGPLAPATSGPLQIDGGQVLIDGAQIVFS